MSFRPPQGNEQRQLGLRLGVTGEEDLPTVAGRYIHIEHLHGGKLSITVRGVNPGAKGRNRRFSVTCRQ
jgi:hypothetical protein